MNVGAVDRRRELRDLVESRLVPAPVVGGTPVVGQLFQVGQRHTAGPADIRYLRISQEVSVKMSARNTAAQMAVNPTVNHGPDQWRNLVSRTDPPPNVLAA